ncbi:hypothetical protein OC835_007076 [Tilletia horrida]|nr:hypothetical protein OC835_007076 [Tilletia horrida]
MNNPTPHQIQLLAQLGQFFVQALPALMDEEFSALAALSSREDADDPPELVPTPAAGAQRPEHMYGALPRSAAPADDFFDAIWGAALTGSSMSAEASTSSAPTRPTPAPFPVSSALANPKKRNNKPEPTPKPIKLFHDEVLFIPERLFGQRILIGAKDVQDIISRRRLCAKISIPSQPGKSVDILTAIVKEFRIQGVHLEQYGIQYAEFDRISHRLQPVPVPLKAFHKEKFELYYAKKTCVIVPTLSDADVDFHRFYDAEQARDANEYNLDAQTIAESEDASTSDVLCRCAHCLIVLPGIFMDAHDEKCSRRHLPVIPLSMEVGPDGMLEIAVDDPDFPEDLEGVHASAISYIKKKQKEYAEWLAALNENAVETGRDYFTPTTRSPSPNEDGVQQPAEKGSDASFSTSKGDVAPEPPGCHCGDPAEYGMFHLACVGLSAVPKSRWRCQACVDSGRNFSFEKHGDNSAIVKTSERAQGKQRAQPAPTTGVQPTPAAVGSSQAAAQQKKSQKRPLPSSTEDADVINAVSVPFAHQRNTRSRSKAFKPT